MQPVTTTGAVSPFMMGLLIGMSVFSVLAMQYAKSELVRQQAENALQDKTHAEDIAKGMEFSILTETQESYHNDLDLNRALSQSSSATGKTRGGDRVLVVERDGGSRGGDDGRFGIADKKVGITATDDTLFRSQLYRTSSAEELRHLEDTDGKINRDGGARSMVTFDATQARERQIGTSEQTMENLAEHVYGFYAAHLSFPDSAEFDELVGPLNLRDVWGQRFDYHLSDKDHATLSFTTPWNYTRDLKLTLKDGFDKAPDELKSATPKLVSLTTPVSATTTKSSR